MLREAAAAVMVVKAVMHLIFQMLIILSLELLVEQAGVQPHLLHHQELQAIQDLQIQVIPELLVFLEIKEPLEIQEILVMQEILVLQPY
jgi:hypothetical protein